MKNMFHFPKIRPVVIICTFFLCSSLLSCQKKQPVPLSSVESKEEQHDKVSVLPDTDHNSITEKAVSTEYRSADPQVQKSLSQNLPNETTAAEQLPVFTSEKIPDQVFERMKGYSFGPDCTISKDELRYLRLSHYGFDSLIHTGEMVVNQKIAEDVLDIFRELYEIQYPIEKIRLIDEYQGDDEASMADNNTSGFNFRPVPGKTTLSKHSYGLAIDINPLYNPYVRTLEGELVCSPQNGAPYQNRDQEFPYKITDSDPCYEIFTSHGFSWGGNWNYEKDYQHFSYSPD